MDTHLTNLPIPKRPTPGFSIVKRLRPSSKTISPSNNQTKYSSRFAVQCRSRIALCDIDTKESWEEEKREFVVHTSFSCEPIIGIVVCGMLNSSLGGVFIKNSSKHVRPRIVQLMDW
jgi:hypothetical protein